jgi:hypothetical protein
MRVSGTHPSGDVDTANSPRIRHTVVRTPTPVRTPASDRPSDKNFGPGGQNVPLQSTDFTFTLL